MESAIAKYDHVVQCLRTLKQIYGDAEMSENGAVATYGFNFSRYLQKLPEVTILPQRST